MRTAARRRVDAARGPDFILYIYSRGEGERGGGILAALGQFYPELGGTLQNRLLCRERSTPSARIETRSWARVASARTL